ncbi:MAG: hypothetical protein WCJ92_03740 [Alphaproteobacteria bacterium]
MRKILVSLLMGGFCSLMAMDEGINYNDPDAVFARSLQKQYDQEVSQRLQEESSIKKMPHEGSFKDLDAPVQAFAVSAVGAIEPSGVIFQKIPIASGGFMVLMEGVAYPVESDVLYTHNFDRKISHRTASKFFKVADEKVVIEESTVTLRHLEQKPDVIEADILWWVNEERNAVLYLTTEHGKRGVKRENCWKNCNVSLKVTIRSLAGIFDGMESEVYKSAPLKAFPSVEIQSKGREWCTKQNPYMSRYEPGCDYYPGAFPDLRFI